MLSDDLSMVEWLHTMAQCVMALMLGALTSSDIVVNEAQETIVTAWVVDSKRVD